MRYISRIIYTHTYVRIQVHQYNNQLLFQITDPGMPDQRSRLGAVLK